MEKEKSMMKFFGKKGSFRKWWIKSRASMKTEYYKRTANRGKSKFVTYNNKKNHFHSTAAKELLHAQSTDVGSYCRNIRNTTCPQGQASLKEISFYQSLSALKIK